MANTIRIHPTITLVANQHLQAAIDRGETLSGVINRLLISQLPKPNQSGAMGGASTKTPVSTMRVNLKNAQAKVVSKQQEFEVMRHKLITITPEQFGGLYDLIKSTAEIKHQLGEGDAPDEVMKRRYNHDLYRLEDGMEYEALQLEAGKMTPEAIRQYEETLSHINVLKDRLK